MTFDYLRSILLSKVVLFNKLPLFSHTVDSIQLQDFLEIVTLQSTSYKIPAILRSSSSSSVNPVLISIIDVLCCLVLSGAGPHPKALSGRLVSAIWWLFAVLLLACYFSNFSSTLHSNNKHVSIKSFEDLANQDLIDYGTVEGGSTMSFFKAHPPPNYNDY